MSIEHSEQKENYLRAIFHAYENNQPATTSDLAKELVISAASVTDMLKKLAEEKLVNYKPYEGATLTAKGMEIATRVERRHRVIEWFLYKELGMAWDRVDEEAHRLEHAFSDEAVELLEKKCGNPKTCAHGNPIPTKEGKIHDDGAVQLANLGVSDQATVSRIRKEDTPFLQYLIKVGLMPHANLTVEEVAPFNGPLTIRIGKSTHAVARDVAQEVWVLKGK